MGLDYGESDKTFQRQDWLTFFNSEILKIRILQISFANSVNKYFDVNYK